MLQKNSAALAVQLGIAFHRLGWTGLDPNDFLALLAVLDNFDDQNCWLQKVHQFGQQHDELLTELGRASVADLVERGIQLWDHWPQRNQSAVQQIQQWIGARFFLGDAATLAMAANGSLNTIVSSQLGRDKRRLTHWPRLLDWAVRKTTLDNAGALVVAGTTLFESTIQFARAAGLSVTQLLLPNESTLQRNVTLANWLAESLTGCLSEPNLFCRSEVRHVWLSPEVEFDSDSLVDTAIGQLPLRDRAAISLADRVLAISAKAGGKIAALLEKRLGCPEFPAASVFVAIPQYATLPLQDFSTVSHWLDKGAVGYVVMIDDNQLLSSCCRCRNRARPVTLQACCSMRSWLEQDLRNWHYLAHCTRGNSGPVPQESTEGYYRRIWNEGRVLPADPYFALLQILTEGRIRGSTWLTRGHQPCVSLSQVKLPELLSRRKFRGHLGRWDWEPYGLIFDQQALSQAKPVVYGTQAEFEQLAGDERVFFQPTETSIDWSVEREWRVAGDIEIVQMPVEAVTVFVRSRAEAQQLATHSRFPVIWVAE